jgi:hypothetical protein
MVEKEEINPMTPSQAMKKKKQPRFPDYEVIAPKDGDGLVTFGTTVFLRKDGQAIIIVFPCGHELHFAPKN